MIGRNTLIIVGIPNLTRSFKTFGSVFDHGTRNKRVDCYNSPLVLHVSLSTGSKICKVVMGQEDSPLRKVVSQDSYRKVILASTAWICHPIRLRRLLTINSLLQLKKQLVSVKSS